MICLIEYLVLVQILLSGSQSAADMTLGFIHIQYLPRLLRQRRIHLGQPLRHVLMYRAFASESTSKFPPPKTSGSVKARIVAAKRANMIFIYWLLKTGRP